MNMNRVGALKITNTALFISAVVQITTGIALLSGGIIVRWRLFDLMFRAHKYNGIVFIILLCLHIYQNWGWVKINILKTKR